MEFKGEKLVTIELLERSSIPREELEKHAILEFLKELPLEDLKKISSFESITIEEARNRAKHSVHKHLEDYWYMIADKLHRMRCVEFRMTYQRPVELFEQIGEHQFPKKFIDDNVNP